MKTLFTITILVVQIAWTQPFEPDMAVFAQRRAEFVSRLPQGSLAIFPSAPEVQRNPDVEYPYRQESNFYYLSGFEESESILLFAPSGPGHRFIMFVRPRDRRRESYEGPAAGPRGAVDLYGADTAYEYSQFSRVLNGCLREETEVFYCFGINPETDRIIQTSVLQRRSNSAWPLSDPAPIVNAMRRVKNEDDLRMGLRRAVEISVAAHREAMQRAKPGMYEFELQAVFEYIYTTNGSPRYGYPCIIGSGPNSLILHYARNTRRIGDGDLILMDCGAEYGYYSADITRTIPANGTFSPEQRQIYGLVLKAQDAAMGRIKPGIVKASLDTVIDDVLGEGLMRLGFIREKKDFRIFSLHGYAHWIGLDVHDVGGYLEKDGSPVRLSPGMVFTLEPGLYIRPGVFDTLRARGYRDSEVERIKKNVEPYLGIGVRIEDDILVTETGYVNLSAAAPRTPDEIEILMKRPAGTGPIR
jgi:Xaa-Pro aminopeptidase